LLKNKKNAAQQKQREKAEIYCVGQVQRRSSLDLSEETKSSATNTPPANSEEFSRSLAGKQSRRLFVAGI